MSLSSCGTSSAGVDAASDSVAAAVQTSFKDLSAALGAYNRIKVDPDQPFSNLLEVKTAFQDVETTYANFEAAMADVVTQDDLGPGAPTLALLRTFADEMDPYVTSHVGYYIALEACAPITVNREPTDCDVAAFDAWEKPMVEAVQPLADAYSALVRPSSAGTEESQSAAGTDAATEPAEPAEPIAPTHTKVAKPKKSGSRNDATETAPAYTPTPEQVVSADDFICAGPVDVLPVLRPGLAESSATEVLQVLLTLLGYEPGPFDGDYGPVTQRATKAFQSDSGIVVDAVVGPQTWGTIRNSYC